MEKTINQQGPAQAGNEEGRDLFQRSVRDMVREGLLQMITDEVSMLCGTSYCPQEGGNLGSVWNGTNLSHQAPTVRPIPAQGNALVCK